MRMGWMLLLVLVAGGCSDLVSSAEATSESTYDPSAESPTEPLEEFDPAACAATYQGACDPRCPPLCTEDGAPLLTCENGRWTNPNTTDRACICLSPPAGLGTLSCTESLP